MLAFRQFGVGCHVVNIAVKLVRGFHFHRVTRLIHILTRLQEMVRAMCTSIHSSIAIRTHLWIFRVTMAASFLVSILYTNKYSRIGTGNKL